MDKDKAMTLSIQPKEVSRRRTRVELMDKIVCGGKPTYRNLHVHDRNMWHFDNGAFYWCQFDGVHMYGCSQVYFRHCIFNSCVVEFDPTITYKNCEFVNMILDARLMVNVKDCSLINCGLARYDELSRIYIEKGVV